MFSLLEFIFQGFFEWVYSLILETWNYFSSALLGVMSLDFAYLKTHIPVMGDIQQVLLAVGWALLLGNLVFQAVRSMASGLGFEGEDSKLLFARTFVFGFLLLASPQICALVLGITSDVISLLELPDAINVQLVDGSAFGVLGASWILVIIFDLITMFMVLSLLLEVAERYMVLAMLTLTAPLAFAMGGSKSTAEIFAGWCRMFGSMCLLMATNIVFFKMLLSVVSTVPSFPDVFLWMVLIISIVKVAKKAYEIITRIGLNPAITGNKSTLPGVIAYTVFRTALSMVTKGAATGIGGALGLAGQAAAGVGRSAGLGRGASPSGQGAGRPRYGGGRARTSQMDSRQESSQRTEQAGGWREREQSSSQQEHSQRTTQQSMSQTQMGGQRQTTAQERTAEGQRAGFGGGFRSDQSSRKTSVRPGTHRAPGYVIPPGGQGKTEQTSTSHRELRRDPTTPTTGFSGLHRPQSGGFTGGASSRGGSFTKETVHGGFSKELARGGGFSGGPRGGDIAGTGMEQDVHRSGGTFGSRAGDIPRGPGFGSTFTQKTEITQSGTAGTGMPSATAKPGVGSPASQPGTAGMGARSTQRPPVAESRHSRNGPQSLAVPTSGAGSSSPVQQEPRRASGKNKPPMEGGGSLARPGMAGSRVPPVTQGQGTTAPGSQPGTAGMRSTRRPPASEPRHSRNIPLSPATPPPGARSSSPVQQEPRRASGKDKPPVKSSNSIPRPGTAGSAPSSRTPPGQKLGGGPPKQKPTRQTKREGGPTSV